MDISALDKKIDLAPGAWVDDIPNEPGMKLKVRSTNFKFYEVATAGLGRRRQKQLKKDEGLVDFTVELGKPLAEHILLDWDLTDWPDLTSGGKPLKYSKEQALKLLTSADDHGFGKRFRRAVEWAGDHLAEILAEDAEAVAGN